MKKQHAMKNEKADSCGASLRTSLASDSIVFSEEDTMMAFRQKNDDAMRDNKKLNIAGCIAKCICIIMLTLSFVFCIAEGYELSPDIPAVISLGIFTCFSFSMIALGGRIRNFGALLLLPTFFILIRFCGFIRINALTAVSFFYEYICGMLYERGYTFLPEPEFSSVLISGEEQFAVFSTEICAFMILIFSLVCVYSVMGKKIRSLYLGAFIGAYIVFSFFIGFYPSNNTFGLFICSLASVFFMVTYEKSRRPGRMYIKTNGNESRENIVESPFSLKKIICFILISYSYVFIFLDSMELKPSAVSFVLSFVIAAICILLYILSFQASESRRRLLSIIIACLILAIVSVSVFVVGVFDDVASDLNYTVSHIYHKIYDISGSSEDFLPGGMYNCSEFEVLRASERFSGTSLRLMTLWHILIIPFSAYLLLGKKFRYIQMGVFSLIFTLFDCIFGFNISYLSIILIFIAVLSSYIMLFSDELRSSSKRKEYAIKRSSDKLYEKTKNKNPHLTIRTHAKQGFTGIVSLILSCVLVFALVVPSSLGATPVIDVLNGQMKTVRALIQAYMGNNGNISSDILGGDIGSGDVTDDPIEFKDITKAVAESSQRESFYLRGWIGKEYDNGKWNDADSLDMIRFKQKFGETFMPDVLYTSFAEFVSRISRPGTDTGAEYIYSTIAYNEPGAQLLLIPSYSIPNRISYEMGYELHFLGDSVYYLASGGNASRETFTSSLNKKMIYTASSYIPNYSQSNYVSETEKNIRLYEEFKDILKKSGPEKTFYSLRSTVPHFDPRIMELSDDSDIEYLLNIFYETALVEDEYEKYVYEEYLALSEKISSSERLRKLYGDITKDSTSSLRSAFLIAEYFRDNYTYTTHPTPGNNGGGDYIESFIFDTKKGYCTHFATAMVNLLRLGGIPARYAEGYYADAEEAIPTKYGGDIIYQYSVMDKNAHAWVEAYIDGIGWMIFEPTAGYGNVPWGEGDVSSEESPSEVPDSSDDNTNIPDSEEDDNSVNEPLTPVTPEKELSFAAKLTIMIVIVLLFTSAVIVRPVLTRKRRIKSFISSGKQGSTSMMKYIIKVLNYNGISTDKFEGLNELTERAYAKLEKFTDGSIMSFDKNGFKLVLAKLEESEFSNKELSEEEKEMLSDYIFRITDSIYRNSGLIGKVKGRFIMNVI